jgi:hypothetical protein
VHAKPPEVVFSDANLQLMRWDDVFVMRWIAESGDTHVRRMITEHTRFVDARPQGTTLALTHVDMENVKPPAEATRKLIASYDDAMHGRLRASATIISATGFGGVVVRSIMSGLALVKRRTTPQDVFSVPRDAIAFLSKHAVRSPRGTTPPIDALVDAYARATGKA